jgi:hypothetical protein
VRDRTGRIAVVSWPNPALAVWLATVVVGWTGALPAHRDAALVWVGRGALTAWALDELVRGESPVRRVLGAVVLAALLWRLLG